MGVHSHDRVRIGEGIAVFFRTADHLAQVFEIYLVADAGVRRDHFEIAEGLLPPAEEGVTLDIALVFDLRVLMERLRGAEAVHLDRVVDDKIDRRKRVDLLRVAAQTLHRLAHDGEIHNRRHAGEILRQYPSGHKGDLFLFFYLRIPPRQRLDVRLGYVAVVLMPQEIFQEDPQRDGKLRNGFKSSLFQRIQPMDFVGIIADLQRRRRAEAIQFTLCHRTLLNSS